MMFSWLQSKHARNKDKLEIAKIRSTYGDKAERVIRERLKSALLSQRDREHWKRIARKL
jgi:hypothetical protein